MSVFSFELIPGEWYLFITCKKCATKQVLFPDLSKGKSLINATYSWSCPKCGYRTDYESEELERYEHKPNKDREP